MSGAVTLSSNPETKFPRIPEGFGEGQSLNTFLPEPGLSQGPLFFLINIAISLSPCAYRHVFMHLQAPREPAFTLSDTAANALGLGMKNKDFALPPAV